MGSGKNNQNSFLDSIRKIFAKKLVLVVIVAVVLLGGGAFVYFNYFAVVKVSEASPEYNSTTNKANRAVGSGDIKTAIELYQKDIDSSSDNKAKADMYITRAELLANYATGQESQVLADAYAAEAVAPSVNTALTISGYEGSFGNAAAAEKYHAIAMDRRKDDPPVAE